MLIEATDRARGNATAADERNGIQMISHPPKLEHVEPVIVGLESPALAWALGVAAQGDMTLLIIMNTTKTAVNPEAKTVAPRTRAIVGRPSPALA